MMRPWQLNWLTLRRGALSIKLCLLAPCLLLSSPSFAATENAQPALDEVQVTANKEKLIVMRLEMYKMEDQFYAEYNQLTQDRQYRVWCTKAARYGTRLTGRTCEPAFIEDTTAEIAYQSFGGVAMPPSYVMNEHKWSGYKVAALKTINASPKLIKLVQERETMGKRYEAARKQAFEGKIIAFE